MKFKPPMIQYLIEADSTVCAFSGHKLGKKTRIVVKGGLWSAVKNAGQTKNIEKYRRRWGSRLDAVTVARLTLMEESV